MQRGGNHAYGMQQGFSMAHNGHPNMAQYGMGGRHHLMNLAEVNAPASVTPQEDFSFKDLKNSISKGFKKAKKAVGISKLNEHPSQKTLDQLALDYGMENEWANIDGVWQGDFYGYAPDFYGAYPTQWAGDYYGAPAGFIY